jgi:hypothetical protein
MLLRKSLEMFLAYRCRSQILEPLLARDPIAWLKSAWSGPLGTFNSAGKRLRPVKGDMSLMAAWILVAQDFRAFVEGKIVHWSKRKE